MEQRLAFREEVLASFGASTPVMAEILGYTENIFDHLKVDLSQFPLPDEPFVSTWEQYARETEGIGSIAPLSKRLVELQFPIQAGISQSADYLEATRRGLDTCDMALASGMPMREPRRCRLIIHPTPAGRIPLLITAAREDFVAFVQALTRRNEPERIPEFDGSLHRGRVQQLASYLRFARWFPAIG